ncbi:DUF3047 domain-containing protein [Vibrio genomosp. F6]|uniref:DUF3047 domain-containing protein n=1 Tax=Vibrio genomosp. F6 str. FF-238 TaxID=1191298 RepID=A0A1E5D2U5_9VIBR|nr:DUF3047 domain-containing protein [Vibrio genomosp. F6]OEE77857.1 hypothetical protein A130_13985 [Vibrio genomosp. F6 str. FF-238]
MERLLFFALSMLCFSANANINVTSFDTDGIGSWDEQVFSGETVYELVELYGFSVLKASSHNTASGLALKIRIDLLDTPFMSWSWRVSEVLPALNEHSRDGDDYAARIYVVIESGFMGLNTKALNYVWSGSQDTGEVWDNVYAGSSVRMLSVRGHLSDVNTWYYEKRNVYKDLIDCFGDKGSVEKNMEAYRYIDIIAVMTDTDNSGLIAESYYGDVYFSAE